MANPLQPPTTLGITGWISAIAPTFLGLPLLPRAAAAQLVPDSSLGPESSVVVPAVTGRGVAAERIEAGAIRGSNLFHSFTEFNVNAGQTVYFANPVNVENILTRITGDHVSSIDGLLGVDGVANLFLLNPHGVIFGPQAELDISGSFLASTGSQLTLADGTAFSALPTGDELLSISVPLGVQFNGPALGDVTQAGTLAVGAGETLTLWGQTVVNSGTLTAPGGIVQVLGDRVGLTAQARIDVAHPTGVGTVLVGGQFQGQGPLPNATRSYVGPDVVINASALDQGNGGQVIVWADEDTRFLGTILAQGGPQGGNGGFVEVSGQTTLDFRGRVDTTAIAGNTGTLLLDPDTITIVEGSLLPPNAADGLWAIAEDPGNQTIGAQAIVDLLAVNSLTLQATDTITVASDVLADSTHDLTLNAGAIAINANLRQSGGGDIRLITPQVAGRAVIVDGKAGGQVTTDTNSEVDGGSIRITTQDLVLRHGGSLLAGTLGTGDAGTVEIQATGDVLVEGEGSVIDSQVLFGASGNSGGITIAAHTVRLLNGGQVTTSTAADSAAGDLGDAGFIDIDATGAVLVSGQSSAILSEVETGAFGDSQGILITTPTLAVLDGGQIRANTNGEGNAGRIEIEAPQNTLLSGGSAITSRVEQAADGNSAGIAITTDTLTLTDSVISASTAGNGTAGIVDIRSASGHDLTITIAAGSTISAVTTSPEMGGDLTLSTPGTLTLQGGGRLTVASLQPDSGEAGTLTVTARSLVLRDGVELSAQTASQAGGGFMNFTIADTFVLRGGSFINAESTSQEADAGRGGDITIRVPFLIATIAENNDIIANAETGDGGSLDIDVESLLGFTTQMGLDTTALRLLSSSDLSASSQAGFDGEVFVTTLEVDPSVGLIELPGTLADRANQITAGCGLDNTDGQGEFVVTGTGGLPPHPSDLLAPTGVGIPWVTDDSTAPVAQVSTIPMAPPLVEAQNLVMDADGNAYLVAPNAHPVPTVGLAPTGFCASASPAL